MQHKRFAMRGAFALTAAMAACGGSSGPMTRETTTWVAAADDVTFETMRFEVVLESNASERRLSARFRLPGAPEDAVGGTATLRAGPRWEPREAESTWADGIEEERLERADGGGFLAVRKIGGRQRPGLPVPADGLYSPGLLPGFAFAMCELAGSAPVERPTMFGMVYRLAPRAETAYRTAADRPVTAVALGVGLGIDAGGEGGADGQDIQHKAWCDGNRPVVTRTRAGWQYVISEKALAAAIAKEEQPFE